MDNIESVTVSCHIFHFAAMNVKEYCSGMNLHAELLNDIASVRMSLANYQSIFSVHGFVASICDCINVHAFKWYYSRVVSVVSWPKVILQPLAYLLHCQVMVQRWAAFCYAAIVRKI